MPSELDIMNSLERGKSIVSILLEHGVSATSLEPAKTNPQESESTEDKAQVASSRSVPKDSSAKQKKKKKRKVVDRRRRRKGSEKEKISSGEESDSDSDGSTSSSGSLARLSSDEDLSLDNLGEDDLELLDSLTESSSSEPEVDEEEDGKQGRDASEDTPTLESKFTASGATQAPVPAKRAGRKHIILAANFNMPPKTPSHGAPQNTKDTPADKKGSKSLLSRSPLQTQSRDQQKSDNQLVDLIENTDVQSAVYTACRLLAEDSSLMSLKMFTYWLHSYPIIIATCTQVRIE